MSTAGSILFVLCAAVALLSALLTVTVKSPIRAAFSLLAHIVALAGLFLTLHAHLLAVLQLIVYAGAVVVLFVFVIMMIGPVPPPGGDPSASFAKAFSAATVLVVMTAVAYVVVGYGADYVPIQACPEGSGPECNQFGGVTALSRSLFGDGVVPFELVGILLTVAVVGAIMVARGRSVSDGGSGSREQEVSAERPAGEGE